MKYLEEIKFTAEAAELFKELNMIRPQPQPQPQPLLI